MDWKQLDINFVLGLIAAIAAYVHNHSWRKSQAGVAPPSTGASSSSSARKPGEVPITPAPPASKREISAIAVFAAAVMVLWVALVASPGCTANARMTTIRTTIATVTAAESSWHAFDDSYQRELVAKATDKATLDAELTAYRAKQAAIDRDFAAAYKALAAAAIATDQPSLDGALAAAALVTQAIADVGVRP